MRYKEKKKEKHLTVLKPEKNHTSVLLTLVTIPWVVAAYAIYELQKKDSEIVDLKKTLKNLKNQISNKEEEIQTLKLQNEFLEVKKKILLEKVNFIPEQNEFFNSAILINIIPKLVIGGLVTGLIYVAIYGIPTIFSWENFSPEKILKGIIDFTPPIQKEETFIETNLDMGAAVKVILRNHESINTYLKLGMSKDFVPVWESVAQLRRAAETYPTPPETVTQLTQQTNTPWISSEISRAAQNLTVTDVIETVDKIESITYGIL